MRQEAILLTIEDTVLDAVFTGSEVIREVRRVEGCDSPVNELGVCVDAGMASHVVMTVSVERGSLGNFLLAIGLLEAEEKLKELGWDDTIPL